MPLIRQFSISVMYAPGSWCLAGWLLIVPVGSGFALAQETSESAATSESAEPTFAGPVYPDDWEIDEWRNYRLDYSRALGTERLGAEQKEALTRGVEYYLYGMTLPEPPEPLIELRRSLMTHLRRPNTITTQAAREYLLDEIVRIAGELIDQPPDVRLNVMILLASLPTNPTPDPPLPYVPANDLLLSVVSDPDQLVQCKIWAAKGLGRISRYGNPGITVKSRIAVELVRALGSPEAQTDPDSEESADWWYRLRLVDALGENGMSVNINQEPIVIDALTQMIVDPTEHWLIRSAAARACTELTWSPSTNVSLVNHIVCKLVHQMAQNYNQHLDQNNNQEAPYWRRCFFNSYLAFQPLTAQQKQLGWGLLQKAGTQYRAEVEAGYGVVLPVINAVTRDDAPRKIPQGAIDALDDWLNANAPGSDPESWRVTPGSEELKPPTSDEEPVPEAGSLTPAPGAGPRAQQTGALVGTRSYR